MSNSRQAEDDAWDARARRRARTKLQGILAGVLVVAGYFVYNAYFAPRGPHLPGPEDLAWAELRSLYSRALEAQSPVVSGGDGWIYEVKEFRELRPDEGSRPPMESATSTPDFATGHPVVAARVDVRPDPDQPTRQKQPHFRWQLVTNLEDPTALYTAQYLERVPCPARMAPAASATPDASAPESPAPPSAPTVRRVNGLGEQSEATPGTHTLCWRVVVGDRAELVRLALAEPGFDMSTKRDTPVPTDPAAFRVLDDVKVPGRLPGASPSPTQ